MDKTWLPACISLVSGSFSLSVALLRILADLDPIGWILSLGKPSECGTAGKVGTVRIAIIPVSSVRNDISPKSGNAGVAPVSGGVAAREGNRAAYRSGIHGVPDASVVLSSEGGLL